MSMRYSVTVSTPANFALRPTVYSHGWCALEPFSVSETPVSLSYVAVVDGTPLDIHISEKQPGHLDISLTTSVRLSMAKQNACIALITSILRIDEPLDDFYECIGNHTELRWVRKAKAGRMLRCGTFFEDLIKMICTTNCSWSLTTLMVRNLCRLLGDVSPSGRKTFPLPETIAAQSESLLRKEVRAGYRASYLIELSELVASGKLDVEQFRHSDKPTGTLYRELLSLKGVGPYAAEGLLKLIGRYDHLALDSWTRKKYYELYHNGRRVRDRTIKRRYSKFGKWAGLVFWLEMTRYWYDEKFPL